MLPGGAFPDTRMTLAGDAKEQDEFVRMHTGRGLPKHLTDPEREETSLTWWKDTVLPLAGNYNHVMMLAYKDINRSIRFVRDINNDPWGHSEPELDEAITRLYHDLNIFNHPEHTGFFAMSAGTAQLQRFYVRWLDLLMDITANDRRFMEPCEAIRHLAKIPALATCPVVIPWNFDIGKSEGEITPPGFNRLCTVPGFNMRTLADPDDVYALWYHQKFVEDNAADLLDGLAKPATAMRIEWIRGQHPQHHNPRDFTDRLILPAIAPSPHI